MIPHVGICTNAVLHIPFGHLSRCTRMISASFALRIVKRRSPDFNWRDARTITDARGSASVDLAALARA
jgi:hypothetical protein